MQFKLFTLAAILAAASAALAAPVSGQSDQSPGDVSNALANAEPGNIEHTVVKDNKQAEEALQGGFEAAQDAAAPANKRQFVTLLTDVTVTLEDEVDDLTKV